MSLFFLYSLAQLVTLAIFRFLLNPCYFCEFFGLTEACSTFAYIFLRYFRFFVTGILSLQTQQVLVTFANSQPNKGPLSICDFFIRFDTLVIFEIVSKFVSLVRFAIIANFKACLGQTVPFSVSCLIPLLNLLFFLNGQNAYCCQDIYLQFKKRSRTVILIVII